MSVPLPLLLALPLLTGFLLTAPDRLGTVTARVVMLGFALAALSVGAGTLLPQEVARHAAGSDEAALFVSVTLGVLLGAAAPWPPRRWRRWIGGVPLVLVMLLPSLGQLRLPPFTLGVVLGAVPLLLGGALPRLRPAEPPSPRPADGPWWIALSVLAVVAAAPPLTVALQMPLIALGVTMVGVRRGHWGRRALVLPALAAGIAIALATVAIVASGDAMLDPATVSRAPGLLSSDAQLAGGLAMLLLVALIAPWPLHRLGPGAVLLPAASLLGFRMAWSLVPVGIVGWAPALALVLIPSAIAAAWRGRWSVALATLAILPVATAGVWARVAMGIAVLAAVASELLRRRGPAHEGITFPPERLVAACTAVAVAGGTALVLPDEVVLATVLAAGWAAAAARVTPTRSSA